MRIQVGAIAGLLLWALRLRVNNMDLLLSLVGESHSLCHLCCLSDQLLQIKLKTYLETWPAPQATQPSPAQVVLQQASWLEALELQGHQQKKTDTHTHLFSCPDTGMGLLGTGIGFTFGTSAVNCINPMALN